MTSFFLKLVMAFTDAETLQITTSQQGAGEAGHTTFNVKLSAFKLSEKLSFFKKKAVEVSVFSRVAVSASLVKLNFVMNLFPKVSQ